MPLTVFLLGQFKITANGLSVDLASRPAQCLLAYLALNAGMTFRREKLASMLWAETSEANARSYLRQALWRIRKALESSLLKPEDYLKINEINVSVRSGSDFWVDAHLLLAPAEGQTIDQIIQAVSLYRGELLPGFYEEWVLLERDRLQAAYEQKLYWSKNETNEHLSLKKPPFPLCG